MVPSLGCPQFNKQKYKICQVDLFGKTCKYKSPWPSWPKNLPNNHLGSTCAFQTILLINRLPLLGESHKNCPEWYSPFSGYIGINSFNHFQCPHRCSCTQAFLHMHEHYWSTCPNEMCSLWKFVQEFSILMCQNEQHNERLLGGYVTFRPQKRSGSP